MNSEFSIFRRIAARLAAHAEKASPRNRVDWATAMRNELQHISSDRAALAWALGCVFASYSERMRSMFDCDLRISRWVLAVEMLCCFTPLTLLWLAVLANLGRLEGAPLHGATTHAGILALTVVATGPIGLMVAFKVIVLNRPSLTRFAMAALWILAAWTGVAYSTFILAQGEPKHVWREWVLIALLPVVGIAHLTYVAARPARKLAAT